MDEDSHRQDVYVNRMPSPPRIYIPPPNQNAFSPNGPHTMPGTNTETSDWKYSDRRRAQQITSNLYLGPMSAGRDEGFLIEQKIKLIILVRYSRPGTMKISTSITTVAEKLNVRLEIFDVFDNRTLIATFPGVNRILTEHSERQISGSGPDGKALVCCETGNERSAAAVVAYLMESQHFDLVPAVQLVNSARLSLNIDDDTKRALSTYHDLLKARRDVENVQPPSSGSICAQPALTSLPSNTLIAQRKSSKRSFSDTETTENELMQTSDDELAVNREFAPFIE